ncbi:MAG TPA: hypothetical protein VFN38_11910 [Gemmatimonadaceae bacterium]|nr:hypothetical protein [Gemmatimonadaceae bacterium]
MTLALAGVVARAQVPPAAQQVATAAGITAPVIAACQGQFRPGQRGWAVAANGRYIVIDGLGAAVELAAFTGKPDLSCYSRAEALELDRSIQRSDTLSGRIAPRVDTAVICAFVEATAARCWQYSPAERVFVDVGGWTT